MIALKIIKGPSHKGQNFPLEAGQTRLLGRSQGCDIRLNSKDISKRHCRLTVLPGGKAEIEDLGSSNGTFVNGVLIKKHIAKTGDYIGVSNYVLQLGVEAPNVGENAGTGASPDALSGMGGAPSVAAKSPAEKFQFWLSQNVHPWANKLSLQYDIRVLSAIALLLWVSLSIVFTVIPFSQNANNAIKEESIQVAKLYARQLARLNQQAVLDQRYSDLIPELDQRAGQTPGLIRSYILDAQKRIILAPASAAGNNFPNRHAVVAAQKDSSWVSLGDDDIAYVSEPIKIGVPVNGKVETRVEALAFVEYDTVSNTFGFTSILNQVLNGLIVAGLLSVFLLVFLQHWTEGTLDALHSRIKNAIKTSETYLPPIETKWNKINDLMQDLTSLLGRIAGAGGSAPPGSVQTGWAPSSVSMNILAAASFDEDLVVTGWNSKMENLIGIRAHIAIGNDISGASRDLAFESTVRSMADECLNNEWKPSTKGFDISGMPYKIAMLYGQNAFLLSIIEEVEE